MEEPVITLKVSQYNKLVEIANRNLDNDRKVWDVILNHLRVDAHAYDFVINKVLVKYYNDGILPKVQEIKNLWRKS